MLLLSICFDDVPDVPSYIYIMYSVYSCFTCYTCTNQATHRLLISWLIKLIVPFSTNILLSCNELAVDDIFFQPLPPPRSLLYLSLSLWKHRCSEAEAF